MVKVVCRQWVLVFYGAEVALLLADLAWVLAAQDVSRELAIGVRGWSTGNSLILIFCVAFSCLHGLQIVILMWSVSTVSTAFDAILTNANQCKVRIIAPREHRRVVAAVAKRNALSDKDDLPLGVAHGVGSWSTQAILVADLEAFCSYVERCQAGFTVVGIRFTVEKAVCAALVVVGIFSVLVLRI